MTARARLRTATGVLLAVVAATAVAATVPLHPTDAAWADRSRETATLGSGRWAFDGSASGEALSATLKHVVLLIPDTRGPVGPAQRTVATAGDRGPYTDAAASFALPQLAIATVTTADVSADGVVTSAAYTPAGSSGEASIDGAKVVVRVLGQNLSGVNERLADLLDVGPVEAAATCPAGSAVSADAPALDDVSLTLLGEEVTLDGSGRASVYVDVNLEAAVELYRFASSTGDEQHPGAEAEVGVLVTAEVGYLNTASISVAVPLVHAVCGLELP